MTVRRLAQRSISLVLACVLSAQGLMGATAAHAAPVDEGAPNYQEIGDVPPDSSVEALDAGEDYVSGEVIVGFRDSATDPSSQRALHDAVTVQNGSLPTQSGADGELLDDHTAVVQVEDGASVAQAVTELSQDPNVSYAQPNYLYTMDDAGGGVTSQQDAEAGMLSAAAAVNDPEQYQQWYLGSDHYGIDAYQAWDIAKGSDSNVSVAVIDTGCDVTHQDLAANILDTYNAGDSTKDVTDTVGHGTSVCGIISAVADNGMGIAGVSYNSKLVVIKANKGGTRDFDSATITRALAYATDNRGRYNIRVVNMSLSAAQAGFGQDHAIHDAVDRAHDAGMLVVCAAGNKEASQSAYASVPGDYDSCLSVMSSTNGGVLSDTSNYNQAGSRAKDLCAPGMDICSCVPGSGYTSPGSGHPNLSGTSFAAPMVSGIAALCFTANPALSSDGCAGILEQTATDLGARGWDERYGYGEVNAFAAVSRAKGAGGSGTDDSGSGSADAGSTGGDPSPSSEQGGVAVLRLYNPYSGEHLFTTDAGEYASLATIGWRQEGAAWHAASSSSTPVWRLYNPYGGEHLYTSSASEYAYLATLGWQQEGISFYAADGGGIRVLRLFNPYASSGAHLFTTDAGEYASLATMGWRQEGTAFLALAS